MLLVNFSVRNTVAVIAQHIHHVAKSAKSKAEIFSFAAFIADFNALHTIRHGRIKLNIGIIKENAEVYGEYLNSLSEIRDISATEYIHFIVAIVAKISTTQVNKLTKVNML